MIFTKRLPSVSKAAMGALLALALFATGIAPASAETKFKRIKTQFIAALGDPTATSGTGAETWGIWRRDPGPIGVKIALFGMLKTSGGFGPGGWQFDQNDWWLDEYGSIMERPDFNLPAGQYLVTGGREAVSVLTIHAKDANGKQKWALSKGTKLHDVTHIPCRASRFRPKGAANTCTPENAPIGAFPLPVGTVMPPVKHCAKQDYQVLLVVGVPADAPLN